METYLCSPAILELRMREQDRDRQKMEWEMKERNAIEQSTREEELMRRTNEDMQMKMNRQDEELRRRQQENTLFMQAQQLNSILDQQERKNFDYTRRGDHFEVPPQGNFPVSKLALRFCINISFIVFRNRQPTRERR